MQEVPEDKGKLVLKIIHGYKHATSIFDDFTHYEKRQEEDEGRKPTGGYKVKKMVKFHICICFELILIDI